MERVPAPLTLPGWSWLAPSFVAVLVRPWLWMTAVAQVGALARPGWWRRWPLLPLPDAAYLRFRLLTQYGDPLRAPDVDDVLTYLRWCRTWRRAGRALG